MLPFKFKTPNVKIRKYTALISQSLTAAPTATVLQNTISDQEPVWSRDDVGVYRLILSGNWWPQLKTAILTTTTTQGRIITAVWLGTGALEFRNFNTGTNALEDGITIGTTIDISVYDNN